MRVILYALLGIVCLLISAVTFVLIAMPTDWLRAELVAAVKRETGRDLRIGGDIGFTIYPNVGVQVSDVSLSAPPGMGGQPFAKIDNVVLDVPILPLLQQKVEVRQFVLIKPVIALRTDAQGRASWDFSRPSAASDGTTGQSSAQESSVGSNATSSGNASSGQAANSTAPSGSSASSSPTGGLADLSLGDVRIEDGRFIYENEADGTKQVVHSVNVGVTLATMQAPFDVDGSAIWNGQNIPFKASATSLETLMSGRETKLDLSVDGELATLVFNGRLALEPQPQLDGTIKGQSGSIRRLAAWVGANLPNAPAFGAMSVSGQLLASADQIALANSRIKLANADGGGNLSVALGGARPRIDAELSFSMLDLDGFTANGSSGTADAPAQSPAQAADAQQGGDAIGDLLRDLDEDQPAQQQPAARTTPQQAQASAGGTRGDGWDTTPIDLSGLKTVDATARISAATLRASGLTLGNARLAAQLRNGLLQTTFAPTNLYGGTVEATTTLNGRGKVPRLQSRIKLTGVSAGPLLNDAAQIDWLEGTAQGDIEIDSAGAHMLALMSQMNGKGSINFANGALVGANIPEMLRRAQQGQFDGLTSDRREKTDFSALSGTFTIKQGQLQNDDFSMIGPLIQVAGAGQVDLPQQRLDYRAKPKLVASLEGQGRSAQRGLEVPFKITGPWANPSVVPDVGALLSNPEDAIEAVRQLSGGLTQSDDIRSKVQDLTRGQGLGDVLDGLFGGSSQQ